MIWKLVLLAVISMSPFATSAQIIAKPAEPRGEQSWLTEGDYPEGVIRRTDVGTVRALLGVDADGKVTNCRIARSSGSTLLDETTCRLIMRRARFHPATDKDGRTIADVYLFSHTWKPD